MSEHTTDDRVERDEDLELPADDARAVSGGAGARNAPAIDGESADEVEY